MNEKCEHCGANLKKWWHTLTPGLVRDLVKLRMAIHSKGENDIHIAQEMGLTKSEYNNFQKLRYFGLVAKVRVEGKRNQGRWLLTHRGALFLDGKISVPSKVQTFRNRISDRTGEFIKISDIYKSFELPNFQNIDDFEFELYKPDIE